MDSIIERLLALRESVIMKKSITIITSLFICLSVAFSEIPTGYYDAAAGKSGADLKAALNTIINSNLTRVSYGDARYILDETDRDPSNSNNCILVYLGTSVSGTWDGTTWNREHVWPQSLMGTDVNNSSIGVGSDLQNLKPADPNENIYRGNKYYSNQNTAVSYAPREAVKGDIARILFYMAVMYESSPDLELVNTPPELYQMGLLDILIDWNTQDPVDDFERNRNEVIYTYQHNRNPFIDHPEYVDLIWSDNPPPSAPTQLIASSISYTKITLSWTDNSSNENGFYLYQDDSLINTIDSNVTTYTVDGLAPGKTYTFSVTAWNVNGESSLASLEVTTLDEDPTLTSIFFSEYIEGSGNNKALEIVNGSSNTIAMDGYVIISNANNGTWLSVNYTFPSGTVLNPGQVWVIANASADQSILNVADAITSNTIVNFNGDDVRALVKINGSDTVFIDVIGQYLDPSYSSDGWNVAGVSSGTKDHTLVRKPGIHQGNKNWPVSAGADSTDSEWIVYPVDTFSSLGSHSFNTNMVDKDPTRNNSNYFHLFPAFPNPFNNITRLAFSLLYAGEVTFTVFGLNGQMIEERQLGHLSSGYHAVEWNGNDYVSGIYLYRIQVGNQTSTGKFILLK